MKFLSLKAYDGTIVKVPENKKELFLNNQEYIAKELELGKTLQEILHTLKSEIK